MIICQSCGMDIEENQHKGTNVDGTLSLDYCGYCYKEGKFTNELTLDEYVTIGLDYSPEYQAAKTDEEKEIIKQQTKDYLSNLKRWK